jgi:hypothetical protein
MIDRAYFEKVLPDQLRLMERPVRFTLHLVTGDEYMVHALVAAHDPYVILTIYADGKLKQHTKRWQGEHPDGDPDILDQVSVPYSSIAFAHLTARSTKGDDTRRLIGFQQAEA